MQIAKKDGRWVYLEHDPALQDANGQMVVITSPLHGFALGALSPRRIVFSLVCATVLLRAGSVLSGSNWDSGVLADTPTYEAPALSFLRQGRFIESPDFQEYLARLSGGRPSREPRPMFIRTPGFPLFIAAVYALGGDRLTLMLAQVLVSGIGIWLTYLLGTALFSEAAGVFGAMVMAVDPLATWCAQVIMPDTLFATLVTGGALLAVLLLRRPAWLLAAGLGTVLAVATLVKPVIYYLPVPLCIMLWLGRVPGKMILGVLAPVALLVGGWQVRNLTTVGTAEFSGIQGINLLVYRAGSIVSKQEHIPMESAKAQLVRSLPPPSSLSAAEMNRVYSKAATKIIAAHALVYLRDIGRGIAVIAISPTRNRFGRLFVICSAGFLALLYLLAGLEAGSLPRASERVLHGSVALIAIYLVLVSAGADSIDRYRLPIMPFLAVYSGAGALRAKAWLAHRLAGRLSMRLRKPPRVGSTGSSA
jgi:hypothetical protein